MSLKKRSQEGHPSEKPDRQRANVRKHGTEAVGEPPTHPRTDGGQDTDIPLELRYAVSTSLDPIDFFPQAVAGSADDYLDPDSLEEDVTVTFAEERMHVEKGEGDGLAAVFDPAAPELLLLHHAKSAYARVERPLDDWEPSIEPLEVERTGWEREFQVGQRSLTAERFETSVDGHPVEIWTVEVPKQAQSFSRTLWRRLLPGAPKHLYRAGLPAEMTLGDSASTQQSVIHVRLVDWRGDSDLSVPRTPPESYDELEPRDQPYQLADEAPQDRPQTIDQLLRERGLERGHNPADSMRTRHALRRGGQDFAAVVDQSILDEASSGVNSVTETFDEFQDADDGDGINLELDWFQQLEPHLDFRTDEGEDITDQMLDVFASMLLYNEVSTISPSAPAEEFPPGLTDEEQTRFREVLQDATPERDPLNYFSTLDIDESEARILYFQREFSGDRKVELADQYFEAVTEPTQVDLHPGDVAEDGVVYFELWNFDTTLDFDNSAVIDTLAFEDDRIRLDLLFDSLTFEFDFLTAPGTHWASVAVNFLTLGIFGAAFQANRGWGFLEYEDIRIVTFLTPSPTVSVFGHINWDVEVDEDASEADGFLYLNGINFSASVLDLIYAGIASWHNETLLTDRLYGAIESGFSDAVFGDLSEFLIWPWFWNIKRGPWGVGSAVLLDPGSGLFEGELVGASAMARDIDPSETDALDYVFSEQYLSQWLREQLPMLVDGETHRAASEFADTVGATLPDPRTAPGADEEVDVEEMPTPMGVGCDSPPMTPEPEFENRHVIERRLPSVDLPDAGEIDHAGIIHSQYRLRVEAVRRDYVARPRLIEEPCPPSEEGEDPGPAPIPLSPRGWANRERATGFGQAGQPLPTQPNAGGFRGGGRQPGIGLGGFGPGFRIGRRQGGGGIGAPAADDSDGSDGMGMPCPTPYCEWDIESHEKTLETYLDATVRVTGELFVGFTVDGADLWLPELGLAVATDRDGDPDIEGEVVDLTVSGPLGDADRDTIESTLTRVGVEDAQELLSEVASRDAVQTTHRLVPAEELAIKIPLFWISEDREFDPDIDDDIRAILRELVAYDQIGESESLQYTVDGGLLSWPIEVQQTFSDHIT